MLGFSRSGVVVFVVSPLLLLGSAPAEAQEGPDLGAILEAVERGFGIVLERLDGLSCDCEAAAVRIDLQAVELRDDSKGRLERWLVTSTIAGQPVNAVVTGVQGFRVERDGSVSAHDLLGSSVAVLVGPGVHDVRVEVDRERRKGHRSSDAPDAFLFRVEYDGPDGSGVGSLLVHRHGSRTLASQ